MFKSKKKSPKEKLLGLIVDFSAIYRENPTQVQSDNPIIKVFERHGWETDAPTFEKTPLSVSIYDSEFRVYCGEMVFSDRGGPVNCFKGGEWVFHLTDALEKMIPHARRRVDAYRRLKSIKNVARENHRYEQIDDYGLFENW